MLNLDLDEIDRAVLDEAARFFDGAGARMLQESDSAKLWSNLSARGWVSATIDEALGGQGGTLFDAGLISAAMGRAGLYAGYASHIGACEALGSCGTAEADDLLKQVARGTVELALLAALPREREDAANGLNSGIVLRNGGEKIFVLDHAVWEDDAVLSCLDEPSLEREPWPGTPGEHVELVRFSSSGAGNGRRVLASGAEADSAWAHGKRCAGLLACAQTVGAIRRLHAQVVDYAGTRSQFGQPIASFPAVQHKLVDVFIELEAGERLVYRALSMLADGDQSTGAGDAAIAFVRDKAWGWLMNCYDVYGGTGYMDGIGVNETTRGVLGLLGTVGGAHDAYERVCAGITPGGFLIETADHV